MNIYMQFGKPNMLNTLTQGICDCFQQNATAHMNIQWPRRSFVISRREMEKGERERESERGKIEIT